MSEKRILWCPNHKMTPEQEEELSHGGQSVIDRLSDVDPELFRGLSSCDDDTIGLTDLAERLGDICASYSVVVLPIGSPAFMFRFAQRETTYRPDKYYTFAHSVRESVDTPQADGSVKKTSVFRHVRFFEI